MKRRLPARTCPGCNGSFTPSRKDQVCCSSTCRSRAHRGTYVVTEADRAAIRRAAELVPIPVPPLTDEQVRAWVAAHAEHT